MSENDNKLKTRQVKAIEAMLTESSVRAAARRAGVSEAQLHRWLADTNFVGALREARTQAFERVLSALHSLAELATQTLREVMENPEAHPGSRVKAALGAIHAIIKSREALEIEDRLRAIEERIAAMNSAPQPRRIK